MSATKRQPASWCLVALCAAGIFTGPGAAPCRAQRPLAGGQPAAVSRLTATGKGRAPDRGLSTAQAKLMAKRAAMVNAYKNMASALGRARSRLVNGTGYETVNGFIKGAELIETRYYDNGDVEVDIEMAVPVRGGAGTLARAGNEQESPGGSRATAAVVESNRRAIGEGEWRRLFGGSPPPLPR